MKIKKLLALIATGTLALTMGAMALTGCGGKDYTFEAEDAETEGETFSFVTWSMGPAQVETNTLYGSEEEVSGYGSFNAVGQKIIWKVNSASDCSVTITLYAASAIMDMDENYQLKALKEADLSNTDLYSFTVNDTEVALTGTLPATDTTEEGMNTPGCWWHVGTATAKAKLKAGDNTIVLELVGENAGLNVDKIVINSSAELK